MPNKTRVIGLLIEDVFTDFAKDIVESVKRAFRSDQNIRLVVFAGKYNNGRDTNENVNSYKYVYNSVFRLGTLCEPDGLIIHIGSLDNDKIGAMESGIFSRLAEIPSVFISSELKGYTTVSYDNLNGISEAIESIINVNGITDLCMLGGRDDNYEARLRKQIFIDCLSRHRIEFCDKMYEPTDMSAETEDAAARLLDRNPGAKAIFCVNDGSAVGLYKAMKKRGLVPGRDILVFGFDNTKMSSEMQPSLTSIGAGSVTLGQRAAEMLLAKISGAEVHSGSVPTRVYGRSSFRYSMYEYSSKDMADVNPQFIYRMFTECFYRYELYPADREAVDLRRLYYEFISRMLIAMNNRYMSIEEFNEIGRLIDIFFDEGAMDYTDAEKLLACIGRLQEGMANLQKMRDVTINVNINRLFLHMKDKAVSVLAEKNIRDNNRHRENEEKLCDFLVRSGIGQISGKDAKRIIGDIAGLGLKNAAVYLFDEPVIVEHSTQSPYNIQGTFPEKIRLVCAVRDGKMNLLSRERGLCSFGEMFTRKELSSKCGGYMAFPIFFGDKLYGFLMCGLDDELYSRGEYIAAIIGRSMV